MSNILDEALSVSRVSISHVSKMILFQILVHFSVLLTLINGNEKEIDYYENLIKEGVEKSAQYRIPKDASEYKTENSEAIDFGEFDYIIVGGGSAGSVIASRLSEISHWNILLLEAGKEETNFTDIPRMAQYSLKSEYNWGFNSTPQSTCCLSTNGVCPFPRGKSLGGTSTINSLIYCRGNKADYDKWAELGNPGWSYKDVLPYFIKSENSHITGDKNYHGFNGDLTVNYTFPISSKTYSFLNASQEIGLNIVDYNGREQIGVGLSQFNAAHGRRDSSSRAFLEPARNRRNLQILTQTYVTKVLISNSKKAYGVLFSHKNHKYSAKVRQEVILSAGVVGSPHLLMLSGVGPKEELKRHNIRLKMNLGVGQELHDHTTFFNLLILTSIADVEPNQREAIKEYLYSSEGPLTTASNTQALGFYKIDANSPSPQFEMVLTPTTPFGLSKSYESKFVDSWENDTQASLANITNRISQLILVLLHPKSVGKIYLKSRNPFDYPIIQSTCLDDPNNEDVENFYEGIKEALKLLETESLKKIKARLLRYLPCIQHPIDSKEYWICNLRETAQNAYHGTGTCKMGPNPTKGDVVDYRLKVHGIRNLRIADTSVIPVTLSAHMNAPAMMIGEKLADLIKRGRRYY